MIAISQQFSEEHYLLGESLYDNGAVLTGEKSKGNLWLVTVLDEDMYDVSIKGYRTKKRLDQCHCTSYKSSKQCPHIVAALLHIGSLTTAKETSKDTKKTLPTALNLNTVLAAVSHTELEQFVKRVAKTDKSFSALLKTVFAPKVQLADNAQKYTALLQPYVKPVTSTEQKVAASDLRLATKLMAEMHDQMEDAITLEQYTAVFDIMKGTLAKMHYLYHQHQLVRAKLQKILLDTNAHIRAMYQADLAPTLKSELDDLLIDICCLSYYNYIDEANEVPLTLLRHSRTTALVQIASHLSKLSIADRADTVRVLAVASLLDTAPADMRSLSDQVVIEAADLLVQWEANDSAILLLRRQQDTTDRNRALEYALIDLYYRTGHVDQADEMAIELFISHREFRFLRRLKSHYSGELPKRAKETISERLLTSSNTSFRASYYREAQQDADLVNLLAEALDLRLLMQHDQYLYPLQYAALETAYLQSIEHYLSQHAGMAATYYVDEVLRHLRDINAMKIAQVVKAHLEKKYPHRLTADLYK